MISGLLKHRVAILKASTTQDALGYPVETWKTVAEVWGSLREEKGSEVLKNDRPMAWKAGILIMRYRSDITAANRLLINGITWDITSIRTLEMCRRTGGLEIVVKAHD